MASKTLFDATIRALECPNCGGPVQAPRAGGAVTCSWCRYELSVRLRKAHPDARRERSPGYEIARLSRLRAQVTHPVHGHAYDLNVIPLGLETLVPSLGTPHAVQSIAREWLRAKEAARDGKIVPNLQHRICWLALALASEYLHKGDILRARAALETGLDTLDDEGHRHILRCRLALEAIRRKDGDAARAWIEECDPAPELLELDGELRYARARLALLEGNPHRALSEVGSQHLQIPTDSSHAADFAGIRIAALERTGNVFAAVSELSRAKRAYGAARMQRIVAEIGAPKTVEQLAMRRRREQEAFDSRMKTVKRSMLVMLAMVLFIPGVGIAFASYPRIVRALSEYPKTCGRGEVLRLRGTRYDTSDTLVFAEAGCRLVIENASIRARKIVDGKNDVTVSIEGSELRTTANVISLGPSSSLTIRKSDLARAGNGAAVYLEENAVLEVSDTAIVSAGEGIVLEAGSQGTISNTRIEAGSLFHGIAAKGTASVTLDRVQVNSGVIALMGGPGGGKIVAKDCTFSAKVAAEIGSSKTVELTDCTLKGSSYGLDADFGSKVTVTRGQIEGKRYAIRAPSSAVTVSSETKVGDWLRR